MDKRHNDRRAKVCSFKTSNTKIAVKARNPGTSLRLCNMPISAPVKLAFSIAKLFNKAAQAEKVKVINIDVMIKNAFFVCQAFGSIGMILSYLSLRRGHYSDRILVILSLKGRYVYQIGHKNMDSWGIRRSK